MHPCLPRPLLQSPQRFPFFLNGQPQQLHGRVGINLVMRGTGAARRRGVTGRLPSGQVKRGALAEQSWPVLTGLETAAEAFATINRVRQTVRSSVLWHGRGKHSFAGPEAVQRAASSVGHTMDYLATPLRLRASSGTKRRRREQVE